MTLSLSLDDRSDVALINLSGRLCFLEFALRESAKELLAVGYRQFVLNCAGVAYVDAFGLGQLLEVRGQIIKAGGRVVLASPSERIRKILEVTKLKSAFEIFADEALALESFELTMAVPA